MLLVASSVLLVTAQMGLAATRNWIGGTNTNFSNGANWSSGNVPGSSDTAQFSNAFTGTNQPQLNGDVTIRDLIFASNLAKSVTLSANYGTLTLNNTGVALSNLSTQTLVISAPLKVGNTQTWQGNSLTISGNVDTNGKTLSLAPGSGNTFTLSGGISGSGAVTLSGAGTVVYSGSTANSYSGVTTVNSGELQLNKNSGTNAINGNLTIGDGSGTDSVRLMNSNQINDSSSVTINGGQLLYNGNYSETISGLTMTGGSVNTGAGSLRITNDPAITSNASANSATIAGNLYLDGSKTISVANGAAAVDLDISANILDQWYTSLTKTGAGTLKLSGSNTFQGPMTISQGVVIAASSGALGASNWNNLISSGAALHLMGGITLNEGNLEFSGTGPDGLGAIRSLSGNNTFNGVLKVSGASTIGIDSGAGLTLGGSSIFSDINNALTINNSGTFAVTAGNNLNLNANLNITGSGNSTISSSQLSGTGTINKTGSGTLLFNGSGTFSPNALNVQEGTVELDRFFNPGSQTGLTVGTTSGPTATLKLISSDNIRNDLIATIRESGTFNLNDKNEAIAALNLYGGTVNTGTGTLTLANAGGDVVKSFSSTQVASINGKLQLAQDNLQAVTFNVEDSALATELNINAAISQSNLSAQTLLVKTGAGTMEFSGGGANTYNGITRINAGTLKLNKTAGVNAIASGSIEVNSGGTLLLAAANQIGNSVNMTLGGGTFSTGATTGFAEKLGTLTLSANSVIDLGSGSHWLEFAASNGTTWNGSATLTIYDWVGTAGSSGTQGQIFFGTNNTSLTTAQLAQISFAGYGVGAMLLANGELVPIAVPEARVVIAALLIVGLILWRERRALLRLLQPILHKVWPA